MRVLLSGASGLVGSALARKGLGERPRQSDVEYRQIGLREVCERGVHGQPGSFNALRRPRRPSAAGA